MKNIIKFYNESYKKRIKLVESLKKKYSNLKPREKRIQHVVFSHREGLRWYFRSTLTSKIFLISLNIFDIPLLLNGIYLLVPPLTVNHIKWK